MAAVVATVVLVIIVVTVVMLKKRAGRAAVVMKNAVQVCDRISLQYKTNNILRKIFSFTYFAFS